MALFEFIKDRKRKAVLFFLTGFFSGGILYFLCNDAAADLYEELWQNIKNWMREESPFLSNFLYSLWKRGKVAFIIFLAGNTRWNKNVFRALLSGRGKGRVFMTIFCHSMGVRGFFSCVAMGIRICFFGAGVCVFFYGCLEKKRKYKTAITAGFFVLILLGCAVQAAVGQKVMHVLQSFTFW